MITKRCSWRYSRFLMLTCVLVISTIAGAVMAAGYLDLSYGEDGIATPDVGSYDLQDALLQPDDKLVYVGWQGYVTRLDSSGDPDTTFSDDGVVQVPGVNVFYSIALQDDDSLVAAGRDSSSAQHVLVARFITDGSLDTTFANAGVMVLDDADYLGSYAHHVAIQDDGKIVIVGRARVSTDDGQAYRLLLLRLKTDGSLDTSLNGKGHMIYDLGPFWNSTVEDFKIQADGKYLLDVHLEQVGIVFLRINQDGSLDSSFGIDGMANLASLVSIDDLSRFIVQPDGKILLVGSVENDNKDLLIARLNINGSLDTSYGDSGTLSRDATGYDERTAGIIRQDNGEVIIASMGTIYDSLVTRYGGICLQRITADGSYDLRFGDNGRMIERPPFFMQFESDSYSEVLIQSDDKVLVAGWGYGPGDWVRIVMRFNVWQDTDWLFVPVVLR